MKKSLVSFNLTGVILFLASIMLTGCADFADTPGKSVWSEGLWVLPWLTGLGSAIFGIKTYKAANSGSFVRDFNGVVHNSDENVPFYKIGWFYFSVGFLIATIYIIKSVVSNR